VLVVLEILPFQSIGFTASDARDLRTKVGP